MKYSLEKETPNTFIRNDELRKNRTNLSFRWKAIAISNDLVALEGIMLKGQRIVDLDSLDIMSRVII